MTVTERFLQYVSIDTQSDPKSGLHPSSAKQLRLAELLVSQLKEMGVQGVTLDEKGYVYGFLPATPGCEAEKPVGFVAHMDTSPDLSGADVNPRIVSNYDGGDIVLHAEKNIVMTVSQFPHLKELVGQDLIVTDGTTLLGADDKAGIAEIMSAVERLTADAALQHGPVYIAFTPDEEIGEGADYFSLEQFQADYAYTVDGGKLGELEYENFNAASAVIRVHGVNIHPGEAKGKMVNSMLLANELLNGMPPFETPAQTAGYEGFFHLTDMQGDVETTTLSFIIRDHDRMIFQGRKEFLEAWVAKLNAKHGQGTFELMMKDSYYNMADMVRPHMWIVEKAKEAMMACGVMPIITPIRGGTDGARLSYMGLPCPNLSTGGMNFHGRYEYIPVQSLEKMVDVLIQLMTI